MENLLKDARVLDLSRMLSGPYGSLLLGDLGAEIIKIEDTRAGDQTRKLGQYYKCGESAYFVSINRNKKSVTLDLRTERGKEIFYELVKKSDVVFDNFRPKALEKLGISYEKLKEVNPKIIHCSISSFGSDGPYRDLPAFDLTLQAISGGMSVTGEPGRTPVRMGIPLGDLAGGMFAAYGVAAALWKREKTGEGARIDISLLDGQVSMLCYMAQYLFFGGPVPEPVGSGHQSVVPYQAFETADKPLVIAIFVEKFWEKLCEVMELQECFEDPKFESNDKRREHREELIPILVEQFKTKPRKEWLERLAEIGVPAAPINTLDEVVEDPQVLARNMVVDVDHRTCGPIKMLGNPVKIDGVEDEFVGSPLLGEHTDEVLSEILGKSKVEIEMLRKEGVI